MHPKDIPPTVAEQEAATDHGVLMMLLVDDHPVWTVSEIKRELDDSTDAEDAVARLKAAGLVHKWGDEFVCASKAAAHFHSLPN